MAGRRHDPEVRPGLLLSLALLILIGGGLVVGLLALLIRNNDAVHDLDSGAASFGNDHASQLSTRLLTWVTDFGDWYGVAPMVAIVLIVEWRRRPRSLLLIVPFLTVAIVGDKLITNAIKDLVDRARPTLNPAAARSGPRSRAATPRPPPASMPHWRWCWPAGAGHEPARSWPAAPSRSRSRWPRAASSSTSTGSPTWSPDWRSAGPGSRSARSPSAGACCTSARRWSRRSEG